MENTYENLKLKLNVDWNNCSGEPDFSQFDGLELDGCSDFIDADGQPFTECGQGDLAQYITLYGHCRVEGGVEALHDFPKETSIDEIEAFCLALIEMNPCLSEHGLFNAV